MKKINSLSLGLMVFAFLGGAVAFAAAVSQFTDDNNIPNWSKDSAMKMKEMGIVEGFPDGSFRGSELVDRNQLVVILDRFEEHVSQKISENEANGVTNEALVNSLEKVLKAYENLERLEEKEGVTFHLKTEVAMAESGVKTPTIKAAADTNSDLCDGIYDHRKLPEGYQECWSVDENIMDDVPVDHYLYYSGPRECGKEEPCQVREWYFLYTETSGYGGW